MKSRCWILVATFILAAPQISLATEEPKPGSAPAKRSGRGPASAPQEAQPSPEESFAHGRQFSLGVDAGFGYKMLFRYDRSPRCAPYDANKSAADQQKFCGFGTAPAIGVSLGFAPVSFFEPFIFGRFGLGDERDNSNLGKMVLVGAGARLYTMSDDAFKFFFAPWVGLDITSGPVVDDCPQNQKGPGCDDRRMSPQVTNDSFRTDILVGLQIGPQYDISKHFGIYAAGGLSFDMLRYLGAMADLSIGIQGRAP